MLFITAQPLPLLALVALALSKAATSLPKSNTSTVWFLVLSVLVAL